MATVNTNDERLLQYENTKNNLINEAQSNYNKTSSEAEKKYNELIDATKEYGQTQADITQQKTDQAIAEINQNKEQAEKDYIKEQKGAYADYAKQTNAYGVNAETQASAGLQGSGYSESSKVSMYNEYQNRYTTARDVFNRAVLNYDNQITQAQIQNNAQLAEIAFNTLQTSLQLALEGFQYKNELLNNLLSQKLSISGTYDNLWQSQYNTLLNEAQFNEQMAYQRERDAVADAQWQKQYNLSVAKSTTPKSTDPINKSDGQVDKSNTKYTGSSNREKIEQQVKNLLPESTTDNKIARTQFENAQERARDYLNKLVVAEKITGDEAVEIAQKFNLQYVVK